MNTNPFLTFLLLLLCQCSVVFANPFITVQTDNTSLVFKIAENGRLYQSYLGKRLNHLTDLNYLPQQNESYITHGYNDYFEPALHVEHNDGNSSTILKYVGHEQTQQADGSTHTIITLKDDKYPVQVKLNYIAYPKEDIIKTYTEISHSEKKPVLLKKYASSMLHFKNDNYYLTEFSGDWANEVNSNEQPLYYGKKVIDTKLGTRANMFVSPFFQLSLNAPANEDTSEMLVGTLGWSGNFQFTFEVDNKNGLRVISGINPYASEYRLPANELFRTPDFYFTYTTKGRGAASRNFHRWARNHQLKNGNESRMTLLNNWEATYFDFNETKLLSLIGEAKELGVDLFLLDDGWFGNKYPRSSDHQGLGDWQITKDKLPNGINCLTDEAQKQGVKFGLWIEPEMVNPKSELYEKHKDWVIHLPNRDEYHFRNQMVLDLSNPKVQDYVFSIVDDIMTQYPDIAFFKWDCNSPITNIYSAYLKDKQSHLYIDYVRGLYTVLERVKAKYPNIPMMLCAGGGGRTDYEALKYFTEFWPSDNTDPIERLFIQWGFSQIFPSKAMCAHVTTWNRDASIKFRTDVAMMGKLGFDINLDDLSDQEQAFCKQSIKNYNRLKNTILDGDLYRLVSPYGKNHTASMYVDPVSNVALVYAFDIYPRYGEINNAVKLQGLNPNGLYKVTEINMMPGAKSSLRENEQIMSGEFLMNVGLNLFTNRKLYSRVVEITPQ